MSELKISVQPLNLKENAPMKTWVENLDIALTKSVRSSDDLSTYAAALLMQKAKVVGTASDKATALTTTVNFTHVMDRVVQQFREDMISVIMANAEDDHVVTEASFRMLPNKTLKLLTNFEVQRSRTLQLLIPCSTSCKHLTTVFL
jgi:hypothetical protein